METAMTDLRPGSQPENAPGRFFVDRTCVMCGICPAQVPDIFRESDDITHSYVTRQPQTPDEIAAAQEMAATCPSNSIKDDGHLYPAKKAQAQTA
jgi:ferredoxin